MDNTNDKLGNLFGHKAGQISIKPIWTLGDIDSDSKDIIKLYCLIHLLGTVLCLKI